MAIGNRFCNEKTETEFKRLLPIPWVMLVGLKIDQNDAK
jgi:hypothetical protein